MYFRSTPFVFLLAMTLSLTNWSCKKDVFGCTDPNSANYNPDANVDSGDCQYPGCTDPNSATYDPQANVDDGSCEYRGCTDQNAQNYDAQATIDDGSCTYARDAFVGTYSATETCVGSTGSSGTFTWTMTIADTPEDVTMVTISNLGDYSLVFDATVDGDNLTYDYTDAGTGLKVTGTGTLSGNQLEFMYTASIAALGLSEDCQGTATRQ